MAQSHKFNSLLNQNGLDQRFVYTIDQDDQGFLLLGTGDGLYKYNGFEFSKVYFNSGEASEFITSSHKDSEGGLWFGHYNGKVSYYLNGNYNLVSSKFEINSRITDITTSADKGVYVLSQTEGVLHIKPDKSQELIQGDLIDLISFQIEVDQLGRLFVGTDLGLIYSHHETGEWKYSEYLLETNITSLSLSGDQTYLIVAAEGEGVFHQYLTNELERMKCCHYTNYQPLWAHENLAKGCRHNENEFEYEWTENGWTKQEIPEII